MPRPFRLLGAGESTAVVTDATDPVAPDPTGGSPAGSDFVLILAALLCALICILGLVAVARCAWLRRRRGGGLPPDRPDPKANRGLKKKAIRSITRLTLSAEAAAGYADCAICLAEFAAGDEIRVLPRCSHAFHVECVDPWLGSHSSCPSCRQILDASSRRCDKCGSLPAAAESSSGGAGAEEEEARMKQREDAGGNRFLP